MNPGELTMTRSARGYKKRSSHSDSLIKVGFFKTPTATAKAGHRSRTSNRNGTRLSRANAQAVNPWKIGGEVPQTRSTFLTLNPIRNEESMKLKKLIIR